MRRFGRLISVLCLLALAACGRVPMALNIAPPATPLPSSSVSPRVPVSQLLDCLVPGHNYDVPSQSPPVPVLLASDRTCGQGQLQPVSPALKPAVSGSGAYKQCQFCQSGQSVGQPMSEELAYYSALTPASVPAECQPQPNSPIPARCTTAQASPWYERTLVWFFVWKAPCPPLLGPGKYPAIAGGWCVWFTLVDATTGAPGGLTSG
jgi:hypothetical protein